MSKSLMNYCVFFVFFSVGYGQSLSHSENRCLICEDEYLRPIESTPIAIEAEDDDTTEIELVRMLEDEVNRIETTKWRTKSVDLNSLKNEAEELRYSFRNGELSENETLDRKVLIQERLDDYNIERNMTKMSALTFWTSIPVIKERMQIIKDQIHDGEQCSHQLKALKRLEALEHILEIKSQQLKDVYEYYHVNDDVAKAINNILSDILNDIVDKRLGLLGADTKKECKWWSWLFC
ncbi:hypothetical protein AB6A40_007092 [Gnathostoma spinigerum]|uniref:Uncharacterized protein n=1 Tax=Gnathostoma spinigerum TaxID=75299 RepID=A0ABD6ETL4_9BILA